MAVWNDAQYLKFGDERTRAARELLARVPLERAERVVDLGCGPGNSTALLSERWPNARLSGVDNSPEMLERARRDFPSIEWILDDAGSYRASEPVDLLFANAVFHWLPDHATLFPSLIGALRQGGALAVQMPQSFEEPSHRLMREVRARMMPGRREVKAATPVAGPAFYYDLLAPRATAVDIWRTTYEHVMPDAAAIVEWVKGTGLRPYLDDLTPGERAAYLADYSAAIDVAYPARLDGKRLFSFPRLFIVAVR
ncbi:MAG TPA: trans-aconitate 2-methyltransferase [Polyangia bacterium]|nr:trans-aconitate 2-methyltransferase [Polyangia bacterium]